MPSISPPPLWSHQQDAVRCAVNEPDTAGRTTLVMASGTGKTRTAGEVARKLVHPAASRGLFAAPYLELLAQTLREWRRVSGDEVLGQIIAVCSDQDVVDDHPSDLAAQRAVVTSDPAVLADLVRGADRVTVVGTAASRQRTPPRAPLRTKRRAIPRSGDDPLCE